MSPFTLSYNFSKLNLLEIQIQILLVYKKGIVFYPYIKVVFSSNIAVVFHPYIAKVFPPHIPGVFAEKKLCTYHIATQKQQNTVFPRDFYIYFFLSASLYNFNLSLKNLLATSWHQQLNLV